VILLNKKTIKANRDNRFTMIKYYGLLIEMPFKKLTLL